MKQSVPLRLIAAILALAIACMYCTTPEHRNAFANDSTWALLPFHKVNEANPILAAGTGTFTCPILQHEVKWEEKDVFNPAAVVRNGAVYLFYRAEDTIGKHAGTSRIGLAISTDGIRFNRMYEPVLYPAEDFMKVYEWEGGLEDPRIVESDLGTYIMTYTAYDGSVARLCVASSTDLLNWTKHGLVLKDNLTAWSKSGAIVARQQGNSMVAEKINGKYWMYFGDTDLFMATSEDLINWQPLADETGNLKPVLKPRRGMFDSRLVESGPFALRTEHGILLLYNGMNLDYGGDATLPAGAYCSGQALFSADDPTQLIDRMDTYFLKPDQPYETEGQVNQVCFIEGLVPFNGKWFLYYGTADSKIGVAVTP